MKTKKILSIILMVLPLVVTLGILPQLPDRIPAHYDLHNQVNRWGSKLETLLFPILTLCLGLVLLGLVHVFEKKKDKDTAHACILVTIAALLVFDVLCGYFLYTSCRKVENLSSLAIDLGQLFSGIFGVLMIVFAIMGKDKRNAWFGIPIHSSRTHDLTWRKSQRFEAIPFLLTGVCIIMTACWTSGLLCVFVSLGIFVVGLLVHGAYNHAATRSS